MLPKRAACGSRSDQRAATAPSLLPDILGWSQLLRCYTTTTGRLVVRDLDRLQEKVVIELDNHQVAFAILGLIHWSSLKIAA